MQFPEIDQEVRAVLWHGMIPLEASGSGLARVLATIVAQRLAPLALDYTGHHGTSLDPGTAKVLRQQDFAWSSFDLQLLQSGRHVAESLSAAGVESVMFKGPTIRRSYANPRHRVFGDIDLLVAPRNYRAARELLLDQDWQEDLWSRMPYDWMNTVSREGQNLKRSDTESVDLHHHLPPWLWTTGVDLEDVARDSVLSDGVRHMSAEWNLVVATLHLISDRSKPGQTLIIWRDLAELSRAADVDHVTSIARDCGLEEWMRAVLKGLPEPVRPDGLIESLAPGRPQHHRRLQWLMDKRLVGRRIPLVQLLRLPAPRAAAYAAGMIAPPPSFVHTRYPAGGGYREWWTGTSRQGR